MSGPAHEPQAAASPTVPGDEAVFADPVQETRRILAAAEVADLPLRAIGGIAIALRAPSVRHLRPARSYHDIDLVGPTGRAAIERLLAPLGYEASRRFNTLNGAQQLLFHDAAGRRIDVFLDTLRMCHELPFAARLTTDRWTLPLAELLLTKLQIVELTDRDAQDVSALLADHELDPDGDGGINLTRISELCASDWGWWRTVDTNLARLLERWQPDAAVADEATDPADAADAAERRVVRQAASRAGALRSALEATPKSTRWKLRAAIGPRFAWFQTPEEVR